MSAATVSRLSRVLARFRRFGLANPVRLLRASRVRLLYDLSLEQADSLGLLDPPYRKLGTYARTDHRARIPGAIPPPAHRICEEDKLLFAHRAQRDGLPIPDTVCVIGSRNTVPAGWNGVLIETGDQLARFVAERSGLDAICKPARGGQGWDILALRAQEGRLTAPTSYADAHAFFAHIAGRGYSPFQWIVQQRERPHPELEPLMPGPGLGTLRIHSAISPGGEVNLYWPAIKIPAADSISDNWLGGRRGSLLAPVDLETGRIGMAITRPAPGTPCRWCSHHPVSGTRIEGMRVPCWDELLAVVRRGASSFAELPALGWDMAVTPRGPVIIEANWQFSFLLPQTTQRRGLRHEIEEMFAFTRGEAVSRA